MGDMGSQRTAPSPAGGCYGNKYLCMGAAGSKACAPGVLWGLMSVHHRCYGQQCPCTTGAPGEQYLCTVGATESNACL